MNNEAIEQRDQNWKNESQEGEAEDEFKNLYDKFVPESVFNDDVMGMHDDMKYMQVPSGNVKEVEVDKRMDASTVVSFLQIIFAMVLVYGKILHEQPWLIIIKLARDSLKEQIETNSSKYAIEVATHLNVPLQDKLVHERILWNKELRSWSSLSIPISRARASLRSLDEFGFASPLIPRRSHYICLEVSTPGGWPRLLL